jgi:hypothetical protein
MSQDRTLSLYNVGAYLGVSHQRANQMFREGKLPEPTEVDAAGRPRWNQRRSRGGPGVNGGHAAVAPPAENLGVNSPLALIEDVSTEQKNYVRLDRCSRRR